MTQYGDPELMVSTWLHDLLGIKTWADPKLPADGWATAPIAHLQRGSSGGLALSLDDVTLDVDVYSAVADHARETAARIWAAMTLQLPRTTFPNGIFCTGSGVISAPFWGPDPRVYRRAAAYRVILHGIVT